MCPTLRRIALVVLVALCLGWCGLPAMSANNFFDGKLINRPDTRDWRGRSHDYYAQIITNIPQEQVMGIVCGSALLETDRDGNPHCRYIPLAEVGKFGKKKRDLLPFDPRENNETIIIIDRSTLTPQEKATLGLLLPPICPLAVRPTAANQILLYLQNSGKEGREYQVLIDIPELKWLKVATDELRQLPYDYIADGSKRSVSLTREISNTVILCNDESTRTALVAAFPYSETTTCDLDDFDRYRDADKATRKIIALNWNGDDECSAIIGAQILPSALKKICTDPAINRIGLTGWQRFCRTAQAQRFTEGGVETWVIGAPTQKYLKTLTDKVLKDQFKQTSYQLQLCDLTSIKSLSVGVLVASPDPDRRQLVMQQQLEDIAREVLAGKIKSMVTTQNWGDILADVLGKSPETDDPFTAPGSVRRVNQASNSDALLLLWVKDLKPEHIYSLSNPVRLTDRYPAFSKTRPSEPDRPDPDDKPPFRGYTYPGKTREERAASDKYQRDLSRYHENYRQYEKDLLTWERERRNWENGRDSFRVNYSYTIDARTEITTSAFVKIIDLVADQRVVWSTEVSGVRETNRQTVKTIPVYVIGDLNTPRAPNDIDQFRNKFSWTDVVKDAGSNTVYTLAQNTMAKSLCSGLVQLSESALWIEDLKAWNLPKKQ